MSKSKIIGGYPKVLVLVIKVAKRSIHAENQVEGFGPDVITYVYPHPLDLCFFRLASTQAPQPQVRRLKLDESRLAAFPDMLPIRGPILR